MPQLYYKWRNGTYSVIQGHGLITYWFPDRGVDREAGEAPVVVPDDFRMVAGDMNRDHFDFQNRSHNAVSFECWGPGITGRKCCDEWVWERAYISRDPPGYPVYGARLREPASSGQSL